MPVLTYMEQQWIHITRILLGLSPPTRRSKRRLRGTLAHWGTPSDWGHWHRTTIPSTIDASQLDASRAAEQPRAAHNSQEQRWHHTDEANVAHVVTIEAQGRGFEHAHIVGTTPSTIDASQLDTFREPHFICNGLVCMLCGEHQLDWGTPMQRLVCDGCYGKECGGLYCSCYDELEPKAAVSEVPEVQAYKPGSKLNALPEAGPVKDAPTIDASQLDASRNDAFGVELRLYGGVRPSEAQQAQRNVAAAAATAAHLAGLKKKAQLAWIKKEPKPITEEKLV